ncbi:putative bifunctional diguanylate cyclase/phosphodiesterase [Shewanella fidelis]|uniref:EAL domain-containing protein n=1 Tax=Shewanella fidelis TaxID=173509 RepID=A0AAW8NM34_9GAMM|nr:EAL domain-containing protein [Shewanella fidelis]MDR8522909.1 EAL domain-containing protein [Shewanella fidelis]MDW4811765.1 EAL domain-containing protein [Shewanella fidelis]MDW4815886.1 EAL domain-containing protein [Shewanella fidelis]MDW4819976.1 EAL domain-containing protein [Shewanella fidelis]MDW4824050.1 EAL domain-containing protein [Shewanella fidelis]
MKERFKSLTWKQTILVVSATLFFAVAIFIVEILLLVREARDELKVNQHELLDSVEQPATNAIWALDDILAAQTIQGLLKVEHVQSAILELDDSTPFVSVNNGAFPIQAQIFQNISTQLFGDLKLISRELYRPFYIDNSGNEEMIGTLIVSYDTLGLTNSLLSTLRFNLWATLARAFLLTLLLSIIFHRFLTQPIARISAAIDNIDPEFPSKNRLPVDTAHSNDELGLVTSKLNQILIQFERTQNKLRKMATRDPLTGLPNRALLLETIAVTIQRAKQQQRQFVLLFIDLDRFKTVNDSLGHEMGDQFLIRVSRSLELTAGSIGTVARLGGDEFVVLADGLHSPTMAAEFVDKLFKQLNAPMKLNEHTVRPAASVGIAIYPDDGLRAEDLIRHADIAMYSAKAAGSNQWAFFKSQMTERAAVRLRTEASLHEALLNKEFVLFFQPKLDIHTSEIVGCEALIRWQKDGQLVSPVSFIPIAEETGIIIPIGRWVIEQSCKTIRDWQARYNLSLPIAINVSSQQFQDQSLIPDIKQAALRYQIDPKLLEIEITETSLMDDIESAIVKLQQLKTAGFGIAVDDFGTGYSSLSYLRRLPITTMKIDRGFVSDLPDDSAIASTILMLGKQLNLSIVAEGIETQEQLKWLQDQDCQIGQGFYFSQPLAKQEFENKYFEPANAAVNDK